MMEASWRGGRLMWGGARGVAGSAQGRGGSWGDGRRGQGSGKHSRALVRVVVRDHLNRDVDRRRGETQRRGRLVGAAGRSAVGGVGRLVGVAAEIVTLTRWGIGHLNISFEKELKVGGVAGRSHHGQLDWIEGSRCRFCRYFNPLIWPQDLGYFIL